MENAPHTRRTVGRLGAGLLRVRSFARLPIWLYRARLGWLFGSRLLMLEHTGRRSGKKRYVVLEVVDRPDPGCYVVASGFGNASQWYRNVRAEPHARVYIGAHRPALAVARLLGSEESAAAMKAYARRHPRAWTALTPVFEATLGASVEELPLVTLELTDRNKGPK